MPGFEALRPEVHGLGVSPTTQCEHWHSPLDIIAIKHKCCGKFYACISCHNSLETHQPEVWAKDERDEQAVLCGNCGNILTIDQYMQGGSKCSVAEDASGETTGCGSSFNPGCESHWDLYFEL